MRKIDTERRSMGAGRKRHGGGASHGVFANDAEMR
jgi:hypothetical protein